MPRRISRELKTLSVWALSLAISGCIGTGGIAPQDRALSANTLATDEAIQSATVVRFNLVGASGVEFWVEVINMLGERVRVLFPYASRR